MARDEVVIPKVWRSEWKSVVICLALGLVTTVLSRQFPQTVIWGEVISFSGRSLYLRLPLLWLIPFMSLMSIIYRIYNVRYSVDARGIEAREGVLSFRQSIMRIRFEDVRSVETDQTLIDRMLDVGNVLIGTAAQAGVEVALNGVGAPKEVQDMIQSEREKRNLGRERIKNTEQRVSA